MICMRRILGDATTNGDIRSFLTQEMIRDRRIVIIKTHAMSKNIGAVVGVLLTSASSLQVAAENAHRSNIADDLMMTQLIPQPRLHIPRTKNVRGQWRLTRRIRLTTTTGPIITDIATCTLEGGVEALLRPSVPYTRPFFKPGLGFGISSPSKAESAGYPVGGVDHLKSQLMTNLLQLGI